MRKSSRKLLRLITTLSVLGLGLQASAMSVDWTGTYRIEFTEVDHTSLGDPTLRKSYLLNSLSLSPKIIAADGVNIIAKFNVLPNSYYPGSSIGQTFGLGNGAAGGASTTEDSNVAAQHQAPSNLEVSQLYLSVNQENGAFVAGRAPLHFGLGMTNNAGNGPFDHWGDTRDMLGYKFLVGNLSFMPILGRPYDYSTSQGKEVQDVIWNIEYNNIETESIFALWYQTRTANQQANDAPFAAYGGTGIGGGYSVQDTNFFFARGFEALKFKLEAGFRSGSTGVTKGGEDVKLNGYGVALEMDFPARESKTSWALRMGLASGDNPETANYEGFQFDRNYDLGFLLFNHPVGKVDYAKSAVSRTPDKRACTVAPCPVGPTDEVADEDSVGNAIYISPKMRYQMADKWDITSTFTYAQLQNPNYLIGGAYEDIGKDVGYELDIGTVFRPTEKIQWVNEVGLLFPGSAFKGGSSNFSNSFTWGFQSKAAISF